MTMLSFRVDEAEAAEVDRAAERLGLERSALLRQALHHHLVWLNSDLDIAHWSDLPLTDAERSLSNIADWGPAEDWSDWA